jgi:hypothetical protein
MPKMPRISIIEWLLGLSVLGMFVVMFMLAAERLSPPAVRFIGLEVLNPLVVSGDVMKVRAEVTRRPVTDCTNGVQAEAVDAGGQVVRLPVPTREITDRESRYSIDLVDIAPGRYRLLIRETTYCGGSPDIAESNWTVFEVLS